MRRRLPRRRRRRAFERLEARRLLATLQNPTNRLDVNDDGIVTPNDALIGINDLNANGPRDLPSIEPPPYLNTNGDEILSPLDVLLVINALNLDVAPPAITVDLVNDTAPGGVNDDRITADPSVAGNARDELTGTARLQVSLDGAPRTDVAFDRAGDFTLTPSLALDGSDDGQHRLEFFATDARNNSGSTALQFTLDTQAPDLTAGLILDSGESNTDGVTRDPRIEGHTSDQTSTVALVEVQLDGGAAVPVTPDGSGNYAFDPVLGTDGSDDGDHVLSVRSLDVAGNSDTRTVAFRLDTVAPELEVRLSEDTGSASDDRVTSNAQLQGTVTDATSAVVLLEAQLNDGQFTAVAFDEDGDFVFAPPLSDDGSGDGEHTVRLRATDLAGNQQVAEIQFTYDTQGPVVTTRLVRDTAPDDAVDDDLQTADARLQGTVADDTAIVVLEARLGDAAWQTLSRNGMDYAWSPPLAGSGADDGMQRVQVRAEDLAGNLGLVQLDFTFDTVAPDLAAGLQRDTHPTGMPEFGDDRISTDPRLQGTISDATTAVARLEARVDGGAVRAVNLTGEQFQFDPGLAADGSDDGEHTVEFRGIDVVGNEVQRGVTFTLDSVAPEIVAALVNDTGSSTTDRITTDPRVAGTVTDATTEVQIFRVRVDDGPWSELPFDEMDGSFEFAPNLQLDGSDDGQHAIEFEAEDTAGARRQFSLAVTLDTTGPTLAAMLTNDTAAGGGTNDDRLTSDAAMDGTVSDANSVVVEFQLNAESRQELTVTNGTFSVTPDLMLDGSDDGQHRAQFFATDAAGNSVLVDFLFQFDTQAPTITAGLLRDTAPDGATNNDGITSDPATGGTVGPEANGLERFQARVDAGSFADVPLAGDRSFEFDAGFVLDGSDDGAHIVRFEVEDLAGNVRQLDVPLTLDTVAPPLPAFAIDAATDSAPVGDDQTSFPEVSFRGVSEAAAQLQLLPDGRRTNANAGGEFLFSTVPLSVGRHDLTVRAQDAAGNESRFSRTVMRTEQPDDILLAEGGDFIFQYRRDVPLGQAEGTRVLRFDVLPDFDFGDASTAVSDTLLVSLMDADQNDRTILSGRGPGTALFSLSETRSELRPGLVRFDGRTVELDVSQLASETRGLLLFQLINNDADEGSLVTIRGLASELDDEGISAPVFPAGPPANPPGGPLELTALQPAVDVVLVAENLRFDNSTRTYRLDVAARNQGAPLGRQVVAVFPALPAGVLLGNASGLTLDGDPYVSFFESTSGGGLAAGGVTEFVTLELDNPDLLRPLLKPEFLARGPNRPPELAPIADQNTLPGDYLVIPLDVVDPDNDPISFEVVSDAALPDYRLSGDGTLAFIPRPDQLGTYRFQVVASDGALDDRRDVELVVQPDPDTTTRVSGRVADVNDDPLGGVPIDLGMNKTTTDTMGRFTIEVPPGSPDPTLIIQGDMIPGDFPAIGEKLDLLLEHTVYSGANNVIPRTIFLPEIDVANAVQIDPDNDTTVATPRIPDSALFVAAGTLEDQDGDLFDGKASITEVPVARTPAALPPGLTPGLVVTIQPGELRFSLPAPLTLPNVDNFPVGEMVDLWSINPDTGRFEQVGRGVVSAGGETIRTQSGGIRNSSWHFFAPPPPQPAPADDVVRNFDSLCGRCAETAPAFDAEVELHTGALLRDHTLVEYHALGTSHGLRLHYDSLRANPRPVVYFGFDDVVPDNATRLVASLSVSRGEQTLQVAGRPSRDLGLGDAEHFWSIPPGGDIEAALLADLSSQPTGHYRYDVLAGVLRDNGGRLNGSRALLSGSLVNVNLRSSPFGAGWSLAGWQQVVENPDGTVLLVDGDGTDLLFSPAGGNAYQSPRGDFSTLVRLPGGELQRTLTDRTVSTFNLAGQLATIEDRNGNSTTFAYSGGRLTSITDPVGLVTTFSYTGGRVTSIAHPGSRTSSLAYDAAGNLVRITDADTTTRHFDYDGDHRLVAETDKLGSVFRFHYDEAGRVRAADGPDDVQLEYSPLQAQHYLAPELTTNPLQSPAAFARGEAVAVHSDGNGNTTATTLDRAGLKLAARDGEGSLGRYERDFNKLVVRSTDGRGFTTSYAYDQRGNLIEVRREGIQPGSTLADAADLGFLSDRSLRNHVGSFDAIDVVRFEVEQDDTSIWIQLDGLVENADLKLVVDTNENGLVDAGEILATSAQSSTNRDQIVATLDAGPYFVLVEPNTFPVGENTTYELFIGPLLPPANSTPHSDNGNFLGNAQDIGTLQGSRAFRGSLAGGDIDDFIRFTVPSAGTVRLELSGLTAGARLGLIADIDADLVLDAREEIESSNFANDATPEWLTEQLPPGTYYSRVYRLSFEDATSTNYDLQLTFTPAEDLLGTEPGNSLAAALDLGVLDGQNRLTIREAAGAMDKDDLFRFTVTEGAAVSLQLSDLAENLQVGLVADINGNGLIDLREEIESGLSVGAVREWIHEEIPPGTYFIRVYQGQFLDVENSLYTLDVWTESRLSSLAGDPGNVPNTALDLGQLAGPFFAEELVGALDKDDYYRFTLSEPATVTADLDGLHENLQLGLVADINGDGLLGPREEIESGLTVGSVREHLEEDLPPGSYFIRVYQSQFLDNENSHYQLRLDRRIVPSSNAADPGNTPNLGLDIGELDGPREFNDSVGALDTDDFYRFNVTVPSNITAHLFGATENIQLGLVADINGDGLLGPREEVESSVSTGPVDREWLEEAIGPGTYFVRVYQSQFLETENSHYQLQLDVETVPPDDPTDPGNTPGAARDLGAFSGLRVANDFVGALDTDDYFRFTATDESTIRLQLSGATEGITLGLVADLNNNGLLDSREQIATGDRAARQWLDEDLSPGTYFVRVYQDAFLEAEESHYALDMTLTEVPASGAVDPGNSMPAARDLGAFAAQQITDHVGALDRDDYYRFTLSAPTTVRATVSELQERITLGFVRDQDGDGVLDIGDQFAMSDTGEPVQFLQADLAAGTYFVRVYQADFRESENSHYRLDLAFPTASSTNPSDPGATYNTALNLGVLPTSALARRDAVSGSDASDMYRFEITSHREVRAALTGLSDDADLRLLANLDADNVVDANEVLELSNTSGSTHAFVAEVLGPGVYYLEVFGTRTTDYTLEVENLAVVVDGGSDPGETLPTAAPIGALTTPQVFRNFVGAFDAADIYAFSLAEPRRVRLRLDELREDADLQIIADLNGNGVIDAADTIDASDREGVTPDILDEVLSAGDYFIRVAPDTFPSGLDTDYQLTAESLAVPISVPDPGDTLPTARDLGVLTAAVQVRQAAGSHDVSDIYRFQLDIAREVRVRLDRLSEDLDLALIADVNGNNVVDSGDEIQVTDSDGTTHDLLTESLPPGVYFLQVRPDTFPVGLNSEYRVTIESVVTPISNRVDPGETLPTAKNLDRLRAPRSFQDVVGSLDTIDTYRFELENPSLLRVLLNNLHEDLDLTLIADVNANGAIEGTERIDITDAEGVAADLLTEPLVPGVYYLQVAPDTFPVGLNSRYDLLIQAEPITVTRVVEPGNDLASAANLGSLSDGVIREGDLVGALDDVDFYRFDLLDTAEVRLQLSELVEDADLSLIADINQNGVVEPNEVIELTDSDDDAPDVLSETLGAGTYYIRVAPDTFPIGQNTSYQLQVSRVRRQPTGTRRFTYDPLFSQITSETDEMERRTVFVVDPANGDTVARIGVIGRDDETSGETDDLTTTFAYTATGQVSEVIDPRGVETDYEYDVLGRLTTIRFAAGTGLEAERTFTYDDAGNLKTATDESLNTTTYVYDTLNRLVGVTAADPDGGGGQSAPITSYEYDLAGNRIEVVDPESHVFGWTYDAYDQVIRSESPLEGLTTQEYDRAGNLLAVRERQQAASAPIVVEMRRYDSRNRSIVITDALGESTTLGYDADDNLTRRMDPLGNVGQFTYDGRDQVQLATDARGNQTRYRYDLAGDIQLVTDPLGRTIRFAYDDRGRLAEERWIAADASTVRTILYAYDDSGNLTSLTDPDTTVNFDYDLRDRMTTSATTGSGLPNVVLEYTYDDVGNALTVTEKIDSSAAGVTTYAYDGLNRSVRVTQSGTATEKRLDLGYNSLGQIRSLQRFADLAGSDRVADSDFTYDGRNRLTQISHDDGGAVNYGMYFLEYDPAGRATRVTDLEGFSDYDYNARGELLSADHHDAFRTDESYTYDAAGNRLTSVLHGSGYVIDTGNLLASDGVFDYQYDGLGNIARKTQIAGGDYWEYEYDHRSRLTAIVHRNSGDTELDRTTYTYDALDRLVVQRYQQGATDELHQFVYDRGDLLLEFFDDDGPAGDPTALDQRYLSAVDQVFAQEDSVDGVEWLLADHRGSTRQVLKGGTGVLNQITYDSFGQIVNQTNDTFGSRYLFYGFWSEDRQELYRDGNRQYAADVGRWLQVAGNRGPGDVNTYVFQGNNPIGRVLPLEPIKRELRAAGNLPAGVLVDNDAIYAGLFGEFGSEEVLWRSKDAALHVVRLNRCEKHREV